MTSHGASISEEAQATLLLCAPLLAAKQKGPSPLSPKEFNKLRAEIARIGATLPELLGLNASAIISQLSLELDREQVKALLGRGFLLGMAVEKWSGIGLWVLCRDDAAYPRRLKERLQLLAPPLLYGCGDPALLDKGDVAIVGSRDIDAQAGEFTRRLAEACAAEGLVVVSGGAKGVDQTAMRFAAAQGGKVIGVLANDLLKAATSPSARELISERQIVLSSPFDPEAGFNVGNAMGRNKTIYGLARHGVVVSSGENEGGTWAGAIEQLEKFKQIPLFVRNGENVPPGNKALIKKGGVEFLQVPENGIRQFLANSKVSAEPVELLLAL